MDAKNATMKKYLISILSLFFMGIFVASCSKNKSPKPVPARNPSKNSGLTVVPAGHDDSSAQKSTLKMENDELRIILVFPNGAAAKAGFHAGDVLLAGAGTDINNEDDLAMLLKRAGHRKVVFEVRSEGKLLTHALDTSTPGWLVLSGDMFKGFLLNRIQSKKKHEKPNSGPAHELNFPSYDGKTIHLDSLQGHPVAILFWGTFQKDSYEHLKAFDKTCNGLYEKGLKCISVNTLELFTMVKKTKEYARELARVRKEIFDKYPILVDMFMESEAFFGVEKVPSLLLLDKTGNIVRRHDGPYEHPYEDMQKVFSSIRLENR